MASCKAYNMQYNLYAAYMMEYESYCMIHAMVYSRVEPAKV